MTTIHLIGAAYIIAIALIVAFNMGCHTANL